MTQLVNPKDVEAQASGKVQLDLLEPAGNAAIARALAFGAAKYGTRNYVESPIAARVYIAAMMRHLAAWLQGEDVAEDSLVHHLGHVGANVHIALAAIEAGTFIDDRHGKAATDSAAKPVVLVEEGNVGPQPCPRPTCAIGDGQCGSASDFVGGYPSCLADCNAANEAEELRS